MFPSSERVVMGSTFKEFHEQKVRIQNLMSSVARSDQTIGFATPLLRTTEPFDPFPTQRVTSK